MSKQHNKLQKRRRRYAYLKRKREAVKANSGKPTAAPAPTVA